MKHEQLTKRLSASIFWPWLAQDHRYLADAIDQIEHHIPQRDAHNPAISKSDVAWHIDHMLKVVNGVCQALAGSDPGLYRWRPNALRLLMLAYGIPRGRGKSPRRVRPPDTIATKDLYAQSKLAKQALVGFCQLPKHAYFKHPYFGLLPRKRALRFLAIHTNHHMKIVRDILAAD